MRSRALGKSRYTDGRVEWAQTQGKMQANRRAFTSCMR